MLNSFLFDSILESELSFQDLALCLVKQKSLAADWRKKRFKKFRPELETLVQSSVDTFSVDESTRSFLESLKFDDEIVLDPSSSFALVVAGSGSTLSHVICEVICGLAFGHGVFVAIEHESEQMMAFIHHVRSMLREDSGLVCSGLVQSDELKSLLKTHPAIQKVVFHGEADDFWSSYSGEKREYRSHFSPLNTMVVLGDAEEGSVSAALEQDIKSTQPATRILVQEKIFDRVLEEVKVFAESASPHSIFEVDETGAYDRALSEDGREVLSFKNSKWAVVRDLPYCSDIHTSPMVAPLFYVSSFKYPFEGADWANLNSVCRRTLVVGKSIEKMQKMADMLVSPVVHSPGEEGHLVSAQETSGTGIGPVFPIGCYRWYQRQKSVALPTA